jgi:hypothetical protein
MITSAVRMAYELEIRLQFVSLFVSNFSFQGKRRLVSASFAGSRAYCPWFIYTPDPPTPHARHHPDIDTVVNGCMTPNGRG